MDGDVIVPVCSALLVVEAQGVQDLVHHGTLPLTAVTDGHLGLAANVANWCVAPAEINKVVWSFD